MHRKLLRVLSYSLLAIVILFTAGVAEMFTGNPRILTALDAAITAPRFLLAASTDNAGGCDRNALTATLNLMRVRATHAKLRSQSKLLSKADGLEEWQTPRGIFWSPVNTDATFVLAEQEMDVYESDTHHVQKGDIVLDCGANIGTFTRKALDRGAAVVVAIEPVPANVESMNRTFAKEIAEGRVIVAPVGVWDKDDVLKMALYDNHMLDSFVMRERSEETTVKHEVELPLTTVDKLVAKYNLPRVDFIKMDIEGAERQALTGSTETIHRFHPRLSVATENLKDDYLDVPKTIRGIDPAYESTCGGCRMLGFASARPDLMFFDRK